MRKSAWVIVLLLVYVSTTWGQPVDLKFRYLSSRDGLPDYGHPEAMIEDHLGRIWIGYSNGLYRFEGQQVKNFPASIHDSLKLSDNHVLSFFLDEEDFLWIGTSNSGICLYDPRSDNFQRILPERLGGNLPSGRIWHMYKDASGIMWFSTRPGLISYDPDKREFEHYLYENPQKTELEVNYLNTIRYCLEDPKNSDVIWLGTRGGLLSFSKSEERFQTWPMTFPTSNADIPGLNFMITAMVFMDDHNLWCGTWAGGILLFNTATKSWSQYGDPAIPDEFEVIYYMHKKDENNLWLGSQRMFGSFNVETFEYSYGYGFTELPDPNKFHWGLKVGCFTFTQDSTLYVAGTQHIGISEHYSAKHLISSQERPIISSIQVNDQPFPRNKGHAFVEDLFLDPDMNTIRFTISWPSQPLHRELKYRFNLTGRNRSWSQEQENPSIQYLNLKGGNYVFNYQSSTDGKNWVQGFSTPAIRIKRIFWRHPLFIILNVLFFSGLIYLFYKMRIDKIKNELKLKAEFEKRIGELEMVALRSQMNPHFIFNSLNSIKSFILKEDKHSANNYLTKFSKLMRVILNNSKQKWISLQEELNALELYLQFESMRLGDKFTYEINVDEVNGIMQKYLPPLLLQPFVENAIWHGIIPKQEQGNIWINIEEAKDKMMISIIDNGIGRKKSESLKSKTITRQKSFGLNITKERLEQLNRTLDIHANLEIIDLYDDYDRAEGTKVVLELPLVDLDGDLDVTN